MTYDQKPAPGADVDLARREALIKLGRFAAVTTPVVVSMVVANKAVARSVSGGGGHNRGGRKKKHNRPGKFLGLF